MWRQSRTSIKMGFIENLLGATCLECDAVAMLGVRFCRQCGVSIGARQCDSSDAEVAASDKFSAGRGKAA